MAGRLPSRSACLSPSFARAASAPPNGISPAEEGSAPPRCLCRSQRAATVPMRKASACKSAARRMPLPASISVPSGSDASSTSSAGRKTRIRRLRQGRQYVSASSASGGPKLRIALQTRERKAAKPLSAENSSRCCGAKRSRNAPARATICAMMNQRSPRLCAFSGAHLGNRAAKKSRTGNSGAQATAAMRAMGGASGACGPARRMAMPPQLTINTPRARSNCQRPKWPEAAMAKRQTTPAAAHTGPESSQRTPSRAT